MRPPATSTHLTLPSHEQRAGAVLASAIGFRAPAPNEANPVGTPSATKRPCTNEPIARIPLCSSAKKRYGENAPSRDVHETTLRRAVLPAVAAAQNCLPIRAAPTNEATAPILHARHCAGAKRTQRQSGQAVDFPPNSGRVNRRA